MDVVTLKDLDTETDEVYMWPVYVVVQRSLLREAGINDTLDRALLMPEPQFLNMIFN